MAFPWDSVSPLEIAKQRQHKQSNIFPNLSKNKTLPTNANIYPLVFWETMCSTASGGRPSTKLSRSNVNLNMAPSIACGSRITSSNSWDVTRKPIVDAAVTGRWSICNLSRTAMSYRVMVTSPTGRWKMCVSYCHRSINTVTNAWPIFIDAIRVTTYSLAVIT